MILYIAFTLHCYASSSRFFKAIRTASITHAEEVQSFSRMTSSISAIKLLGNRMVLLVVAGMVGILNIHTFLYNSVFLIFYKIILNKSAFYMSC